MPQHFLPYWLAALYLPDIQPRTFMRWLDNFPDIEKLFLASQDELRAAGLSPQQIQDVQQPQWKQVEKDLAWVQQEAHHHLITFDDAAYPVLLKEISSAPLVLYLQGDKFTLCKPQIAMVGSRNATPSGIKSAEHFAYSLAQAGIAVTSGLALGVDGASHRGALAAKGVTIAVSGAGLNHIYPRLHQPLANDIIRHGGALISEFPLTTEPRAYNFPRRNRIIAGLSIGVLVVEAALKSGSLITARYALEQGREVFAIPGSIHNPLARGCHALIRQGAKLVETVADIIEELSAFSAMYNQAAILTLQVDEPDDLPLKSRQLLKQIDYVVTPLDMIILRSRLTAGEVSSILLSLELLGCIQSVPGGFVRTVTTRKVD